MNPSNNEPRASQPRLAIYYCPRCGWLTRAAWMAQEIGRTFETTIGEIALVPAPAGVFETWLDGECVHSRATAGDFPSPKQIKQAIRDRLSPELDLGHSEPKDARRPDGRTPGKRGP